MFVKREGSRVRVFEWMGVWDRTDIRWEGVLGEVGVVQK